jgi:hypothetical protein
MAMQVQAAIRLTDADQGVYYALTAPADKATFLVAKLAAQFAPALLSSLANANILDLLSELDQQAIGALIAAVKASASVGTVPNG